jgi:UDP-glucose 4-epimerase
MKRYLVTGGCGFIGSHLVDALLRAGHHVRVVDDLSTGDRRNLAPAAELMVADAGDPAVLATACADINGAFHLAAIASVSRCHEEWVASHRINLGATVALLEAAAGNGRRAFPIVYASSSAVYGDNPDMPLRETHLARPQSAYGVDKYACELHARMAASVFGIASLGLRFFNVYGPRQRDGDAYAGVISAFAGSVSRGMPLTIHGDGGQTRDFVYVGDVVTALLAGMGALQSSAGRDSPHVVNVCTGQGTSIRELAQLVMDLGSRPVPVRHGPARTGDILRSVGSPDAAFSALGFRAAISLRQGLMSTLVAWRRATDAQRPAALVN